ncbi:MAG TPA: alpha-amylase family glycosyl hydrolase [Gammaproteobacteria bacterium]|nr:alpha-amylase family glycosyl hydrolase [Gammaproteobacteria bacterium]
MSEDRDWWRQGPIYQLLVASFQDTTDDGFGDLPGVEQRLDYLEWLGARAVWLSPIYRSPFRELGYDVMDYEDVDPRFGTLDDFDRLLAAAHRRGIKIILDWVPNHTSDRHAWFRDACSSRGSPHRDWYIWRDAKPDGSVPNNWISIFGGSVWQWHEPTQRYYLHSFLPSQPDLNWRKPAVREALHGTLRFWLDRGVDGFRIDAACLMLKDERFRDNPPNPDFEAGGPPDAQVLPVHTRNQPGLHACMAEIRALVDAYGVGRVLLGELFLPVEDVVTFYGEARPELHLPLNMSLTSTPWNAPAFGQAVEDYQRLVPADGWPVTMLGSHDSSRLTVRAPGEQRRVAAMLALTQRGTTILYYGEEIGMAGVFIPPERARDPQGRRTGRNRDPERTPMQWSAERNAGFSTSSSWLPIGTDYASINVETQRADLRSLLGLYRRLIELRRRDPALAGGTQRTLECESRLLAYERAAGGRALVVALNFSAEPQRFTLGSKRGRILLSTFLDREEACGRTLELRGDEGVIIEIAS